MSKKQIIILVVLLVIVAAAVFLYWFSYDHWPWQKGEAAVPTTSVSPSLSENPDPRMMVMNDLAAKIGQISPEPPVLGGHWFVDRFWFIEGSYSTFYVEYEDGHILQRLLLAADLSQPSQISYDVKAFFEPGESDWILKSGKDQTSDLPLILYEYEEAKGEWVRKN